jgi:phasin family protein
MSQKPRTGDQARLASTAKSPAKDTAAKSDPMKTEAAAEPLPGASTAAVRPMPTDNSQPSGKTHPVAKAQPIIKMGHAAEVPAVALPRVGDPQPVSKVELMNNPAPMGRAPDPATVSPTVVEQSVAAPIEAAEKAIKAATDTVATATADVTRAAEPTKTTVTEPLTQGMKSMMKSTEDLVAFGQANLEAFVKSGQIWSAGVQELTKQMATSAKASFEDSMSTFKAMSTVKSVKEAIDLQSTFAKATLEKAMAESNKLTDASIKLTEQTLAPITARVTVAVETFGKTA